MCILSQRKTGLPRPLHREDITGQVQPQNSSAGAGLLPSDTSAGISSHHTSNLTEGHLHPVILLCFHFCLLCAFNSRISWSCAIFITYLCLLFFSFFLFPLPCHIICFFQLLLALWMLLMSVTPTCQLRCMGKWRLSQSAKPTFHVCDSKNIRTDHAIWLQVVRT